MVADLRKGIFSKVLADALASPTAKRLPDEPEPVVCGRCKGAGFVSGPWQRSGGLDAKATSRGESHERPIRPCPACTEVKGPTVAEACTAIGDMGEANLSLQALQRGERWCVFMRGSVGVGKTFLARAHANSLRTQGRIVCDVVCADLLDRLGETQRKVDPKVEPAIESLTQALDFFANYDVLLIDDLGAERMTEWRLEQLFKIIDRRWLAKRTTIITSNIKATEVKAKIGDRIYSRLRSSEVIISGKDRR